MTNLEILKEEFILLKNYKKTAYSYAHIDSIIKCNTAANKNAIGEIDEIIITESDNVVIVRSDGKRVNNKNQNPFIEFEIKEYNRKSNYNDDNNNEIINSEQT